jgi:hypothetical protein
MAKKKRGRGRPKLPRGVSKAWVVTLRLERGQRQAILAAAKREGTRPSHWMRLALMAAAADVNMEKPEVEGVGIEPRKLSHQRVPGM